jgi:hypothetical protein
LPMNERPEPNQESKWGVLHGMNGGVKIQLLIQLKK